MTKTVKDVKRPNPQTPTSLRRGCFTGRAIYCGGAFYSVGTYDVRRNEWKRLRRFVRATQLRGDSPARVMGALDRVHQIEAAWRDA